jgi:hypothetical protein
MQARAASYFSFSEIELFETMAESSFAAAAGSLDSSF